MGHVSEKEDALLRAISELRAVADRLIDEQIARVNALPDEPALGAGVGSNGSAPVLPATAEAGPRVTTVAQVKTAPRLTNVGVRPQALVASAPRSAADPATAPAARVAPAQPVVAETPRRTTFALPEDDSKLRLDALAKHLDDRMRRSRDAAAEKQKSGAGL